jgi:phage terminase large subunit-like protein
VLAFAIAHELGHIALAHKEVDTDKLEEQMCLFSREGYKGEKSPDRADAMVWAVTELMLGDNKYNGYTLAHVR